MPYKKYLTKKAIDLGVKGVIRVWVSTSLTKGGIVGWLIVFNFKRIIKGLKG